LQRNDKQHRNDETINDSDNNMINNTIGRETVGSGISERDFSRVISSFAFGNSG